MVNYAESESEDDEDDFKPVKTNPTRARGRAVKRRKTIVDDEDFSHASDGDVFHEGKDFGFAAYARVIHENLPLNDM